MFSIRQIVITLVLMHRAHDPLLTGFAGFVPSWRAASFPGYVHKPWHNGSKKSMAMLKYGSIVDFPYLA